MAFLKTGSSLSTWCARYFITSIQFFFFAMTNLGDAQVSAPEGLKTFTARYPSVKVVGFVFSKSVLYYISDGTS